MSDRLIVELTAALGTACLVVGVAVIYWPAALIVGGVLLLTLAIAAWIHDDPQR